MKKLIYIVAMMLMEAMPVMAQVSVDFDSLTVGTVDTNNIVSPTLNELNAASSVGIALDECGKWVTSITINNIGAPPDGKPVEYYIEQH